MQLKNHTYGHTNKQCFPACAKVTFKNQGETQNI